MHQFWVCVLSLWYTDDKRVYGLSKVTLVISQWLAKFNRNANDIDCGRGSECVDAIHFKLSVLLYKFLLIILLLVHEIMHASSAKNFQKLLWVWFFIHIINHIIA